MNVLVIGKFNTEGFGLHIAETLGLMGHVVQRFEHGVPTHRVAGRLGQRFDQIRTIYHEMTDRVPVVRRRRARALWAAAGRGPLDVALVCHDFLWPEEVHRLREATGAAVALWCPDHLANFGRGYFMDAPYDAIFLKDPYAVRALAPFLRSPVHYLPECFNPQVHRCGEAEEPSASDYDCDIVTAGTLHAYRAAVFAHLGGHHVQIWGPVPPPWLRNETALGFYQGRPAYGADKARVFRRARIVLNNLHYGEIWGLNARAFEAAGIGAFQMIDWRPGLAQLFEDGKELIAFRGAEDMRAQIAHWLPRTDERNAIAAAGMRRAHAEHTYRHRLRLLLDTLAGRERGFALADVKAAAGTRVP